MTRSLRYQDELREHGHEHARWRVVEFMPKEGCVKLFDRELLTEVVRKLPVINKDIVDGRLHLLREGAPKKSAAVQSDPSLDMANKRALSLVGVIQSLQKQHSVSINKAYKMAVDAHVQADGEASEPLPSRASIYRYLESKRRDLPIFKGNQNKGNRIPRYSADVVDLVCRIANSYYLVPGSRWTLRDLTRYVQDRAHDSGLLDASRSVSQKFVLNVIHVNESVDPETDRMDPKLVAAAKSKAPNRIVTTFPFERVEQDAVHLPFVVETPHGIASNIYLIHAIDCCTGMVVGWYLMVGSPSESDGLRCVQSILYSKVAKFEELASAMTLTSTEPPTS